MLSKIEVVEDHGTSDWQSEFLQLLPAIERYANFALRDLDYESKQDGICDVIAKAMQGFRRLYDKGKQDYAHASTLARFAIAQYRDGRRFGTSISSCDVMVKSSPFERDMGLAIDHYCDSEADPVFGQVALMHDFQLWMKRHSSRDRRIIYMFLLGYTTTDVSKRFNLSCARVSQLRKQFAGSWFNFC